MGRPAQSAKTFWSRVDKSGGPDACWEWRGWRDRDGYGALSVMNKFTRAHRFAFELERGPIPAGLVACHACDNPGCCNPSHLFVGTAADNNRDKEQKGRAKYASGEEHHHSSMTAQMVHEIRAGFLLGVSYEDLARLYGTNRQNVSQLVLCKRWAA